MRAISARIHNIRLIADFIISKTAASLCISSVDPRLISLVAIIDQSFPNQKSSCTAKVLTGKKDPMPSIIQNQIKYLFIKIIRVIEGLKK
jgi:hypothetical protein